MNLDKGASAQQENKLIGSDELIQEKAGLEKKISEGVKVYSGGNVSLSEPITLLMIAAALLALPNLLAGMADTMAIAPAAAATAGKAQNLGQLSANMAEMAKSMTNMLSAMGYIMGLGFAIKAALKFKEHSEGGTTCSSRPLNEAERAEANQRIGQIDGILAPAPSKADLAKLPAPDDKTLSERARL